MRQLQSVIAALLLINMISSSFSTSSWGIEAFQGPSGGKVPCHTKGILQNTCPEDAPICCAWPSAIIAACCMEGTKCELDEGRCVDVKNSSRDASSDGRIKDPGVNLDVGTAAGILAIGILGSFAAIIFAFVCGYKAHLALERRRRQRREAERQAMLARQAAEEAEEENTGFDLDDEDEGICKICFSRLSNCVLLECGHVCCCYQCGKKLKKCPICRNQVKKLVKTKVRKAPDSARFSFTTSSECATIVAPDTATSHISSNDGERDDDDDAGNLTSGTSGESGDSATAPETRSGGEEVEVDEDGEETHQRQQSQGLAFVEEEREREEDDTTTTAAEPTQRSSSEDEEPISDA